MACLQRIRDLSRLTGIHKRWIYESHFDMENGANCLQKIGFSISDFNREIEYCLNSKYEMKDIVYLIVLANWVADGVYLAKQSIKKRILDNYNLQKKDDFELKKACSLVKALRSITVAHPLKTEEHKDYGFDGNFVCTDIYSHKSVVQDIYPNDRIYELTFKGLHNCSSNTVNDFYLKVFSQRKDEARFSNYIGCNFSDLIKIVSLYIKELYLFDRFLKSQRKKDYINE